MKHWWHTTAIVAYLMAVGVGVVALGAKLNSEAKDRLVQHASRAFLEREQLRRSLTSEEKARLVQIGVDQVDRSLEILLTTILLMTLPCAVLVVWNRSMHDGKKTRKSA